MIEFMRKLLTYGLTGGSAAIVDLGGFAALQHAGLGLAWAAIASFWVATVFNYVLTSLHVFRTKPSPRRYLRFLAAALVGAGVNIGVTLVAVHWFALAPVLGKAAGISVAFLMNFAMNMAFVFRAPASERAKAPGAPR